MAGLLPSCNGPRSWVSLLGVTTQILVLRHASPGKAEGLVPCFFEFLRVTKASLTCTLTRKLEQPSHKLWSKLLL